MPRKKKLVVGDKAVVRFLGGIEECVVIEVMKDKSYKFRMRTGTIIPNCFWKQDAPKKAAWYIEEYLGKDTNVKSAENHNTKDHTTGKNKLKDEIKKQQNFIRGKHKKG